MCLSISKPGPMLHGRSDIADDAECAGSFPEFCQSRMKLAPITVADPQEPLSSAVPEHTFLVYCTEGGEFMLKLQGDDLVCEFDNLAKAVLHAANCDSKRL
jgi:hypothetical protein